ncbi:PREDICTED: uncharacterized protein LOC108549858, partial [Eufriesea mexicana]|uniref:uncharacterized protein LOC108549858 n=1 Tax=Eufriesea mexicana TaxID=516756 RepID=UPI00083BFE62
MKIVYPTAVSHLGYSNLQNNYRCNNHTINVQPDVPCINIILRSDCKMHSSQYNYVQKENSHNENTLLSQANKDSVRTESKALNMPQFNSFNRKYDHFVFGTKNRLDVSQSVRLQYERKYNQGNKNLTSNNVSQIHYNRQMTMLDKDITKDVNTDDSIKTNFNSFSVTKLESSIKQKNENNVSRIIKTDLAPNLENIAKTEQNFVEIIPIDLKSTLKHFTNLELKPSNTLLNSKFTELESFPKSMKYKPCKKGFYMNSLTAPDIAKNLMKNDGVKNTICINETNDISKINDEKYKTETSYEKSKFDKNILGIKKFTNLSIEKSMDTCTNTNCNGMNSSILNIDQDECGTRISNTRSTSHIFLQFKKDFHYKKCETKCSSTINNTVNILQNMVKDVKKFKDIDMTKYNGQNDQYKNIDSNCMKERNDVILSKIKHNFFNQSEIIRPEYMKMLQEIKKHTEKLEEQLIIMNKNKNKKKINKKLDYTLKNYIKQQRDMITQNPEKKNIYVQEPCSHDNIKCFQDKLLKSGNNLNLQLKQITRQDRNVCRKASNIKDISYKRNNMKSLVYCDNDCLRSIKNVEIQCVRSFHIFDSSNLKPLATSTPKKVRPLKNEKSLHNISNCTQTISIPKANLQITHIKKIVSNEFKSSMIEQENKEIKPININSNWDENAIIMLLLTKDTNGKCLKCKYKKSEFLHFRPKNSTNSLMCDRKLTKYRLSKQKMQIPIVFKLMCVRCKSEDDLHSNEYNRKYSAKSCANSCKVSDLVTTVYTQSSNLQITTATSVSCISFTNRNDVRNFNEE